MAAVGNRVPDDTNEVMYLNELIQDRALLDVFPRRFKHVERLVDQEIVNVRSRLFDCNFFGGEKLQLPEPVGEPVLIREKLYIPDSGRHYNFVGRLLGPRGKTLKSIEQETGCKIMIRGTGSTRTSPTQLHYQPHQAGDMVSPPHSAYQFNHVYASPPRFGQQQQTPNEDEADRLHVIIQCEDSPNRAQIRMRKAIELIEELFKPVDEANDELKRKQLLELALLKGTFKPSPRHAAQLATPQKIVSGQQQPSWLAIPSPSPLHPTSPTSPSSIMSSCPPPQSSAMDVTSLHAATTDRLRHQQCLWSSPFAPQPPTESYFNF